MKILQALFGGIGVFVLLYNLLLALYHALSYPVLYYFAISTVNLWYKLLEGYLPYTAWLPAGLWVGYWSRRRGWVYAIASVILYQLSLVEIHLQNARFPLDALAIGMREGLGWRWVGTAWLGVALLVLPVLIFSLSLAALGGWVGERMAQRDEARRSLS